jgi:hypothetical protein
MSYLVLCLFVLACGWNVYRDYLPTRTVAIRVKGHPQHFGAVLTAGYLLILAACFHAAALHWPPYLEGLKTFAGALPQGMDARPPKPSGLISANGSLSAHESLVAVSAWAGALSLLLPQLLNLPFRLSTRLRIRAVFHRLNEVEQLLSEVLEDGVSLAVTLSTGKVYVGVPLEADVGSQEIAWIRLQPLVSGYRDEKGNFVPTTPYKSAYDAVQSPSKSELCKDDFRVVLPLASIVSLQKFDLDFFVDHFLASQKPDGVAVVEDGEGELEQEAETQFEPSVASEQISDRWLIRLHHSYVAAMTLTVILAASWHWMMVFSALIATAILCAVWEPKSQSSGDM